MRMTLAEALIYTGYFITKLVFSCNPKNEKKKLLQTRTKTRMFFDHQNSIRIKYIIYIHIYI